MINRKLSAVNAADAARSTLHAVYAKAAAAVMAAAQHRTAAAADASVGRGS